MSGLRSVLDEIAGADFDAMSDAEVEEAFHELERASRILQSHLLRCLSSIDRRATYASHGFVSTTSWLHGRHGMAGGSAREQVRVARSLPEMPVTAEAFQAAEVPPDAVRVLASASEADRDAFRRDEDVLLEAAVRHPLPELLTIVAFWRQSVEGEDLADRMWQQRRLFVSRLLDGMVRVDGTLDPESG